MTQTPNVGLPYVPEDTLDPAAGLNLALDVADALIQTSVLSMDLTAPPGSPSDGDLYIVAAFGGTATGAWADQESNLARYVAEGTFWKFYAAGDQVKFVLNIDDGGFYKFIPETSGGAWVVAAGLDDAPNDGTLYARRSGAWDTVPTLTIATEESFTSGVDDVTALIVGEGLEITEISPGVVLIEALAFPTIVNVTGTSRVATIADRNTYCRFTNAAAKTYTFDGNVNYVVGHEYHGRNVGAGNLTIVAANGMTIHVPTDGGLVIPQGGTFTIKIVGTDEADLFGVSQS